MEKQQLDQNNTTESIQESRRRFAKTGLITSGVLLTLANRSALGAVTCTTPSGFSSINASNHPHTCNGVPPQSWQQPSSWPTPYTNQQDLTVGALFNSPLGSTAYNLLVSAALNNGNQDLIACYIAALFNSTMVLRDGNNWSTPLTDDQVKIMFNDHLQSGYGPITINGTSWSTADQLKYLHSTMGL